MTYDVSALKGGVAVVTGGAGKSAGLGQGLVRQFAAAGMRTAILDFDGDAAEALANKLAEQGCEAIACTVDVRDNSSLLAAAAKVGATFGSCNILCAHAGINAMGPVDTISLSKWRDTFEMMVVGGIATIQAFLPLMRQTQGLRRIVLTSSAAALSPGRLQAPYRAAKTALTSIGESLDLELGPEGIGATVVFPSGMVPPSLLPPSQSGGATITNGTDPVTAQVIAEMMRHPSDLAGGEVAAIPVIKAILAGRRYVVTHGSTVERGYVERSKLLEEAFAELAARDYRP